MAYLSSSLRGLAALLFVAVPILAHAATLNVPSAACPTVQSGVDAAHDGDTVLVSDGTYTGDGNRDIDFHGKSLTVKSLHGPTKTIIDCGGYKSKDGSGNHRGFYLHSGEKKVGISGFTVKNGYEDYIPGLPVADVLPTIKNNYTDSLFELFSNGAGGGICITNGNNASIGTITLTNCTLSGNTASDGGGIENGNYIDGGTIMLTGCTISGNTAFSNGGGIVNDGLNHNSTITLTGCTISRNRASFAGGGVENYCCSEGRITLTNCIVTGNRAVYGGGIENDMDVSRSSRIALTGCTLLDNTASHGGGIYNDNFLNDRDGTITLTDGILYQNIGGEIANHNIFITVSYSDIQGGYAGTGNINKNPLFVNAIMGDLHLKLDSPCLGKGTRMGAYGTKKP